MNIDEKLLQGLRFRYSEEKIVTENGRKIKKYIPQERDLTVDDILSMKDYGDSLMIVTADGKKYSIQKKNKKGGK